MLADETFRGRNQIIQKSRIARWVAYYADNAFYSLSALSAWPRQKIFRPSPANIDSFLHFRTCANYLSSCLFILFRSSKWWKKTFFMVDGIYPFTLSNLLKAIEPKTNKAVAATYTHPAFLDSWLIWLFPASNRRAPAVQRNGMEMRDLSSFFKDDFLTHLWLLESNNER